ncbi:MAG TPA: dienelactone hydrolase family protein [Terriglobales bacterium]|nr:dienelactone hydrolase family protein [Terriglobales bacterium]
MSEREELVLFHSAYGRRPAVLEFADQLRAAGHTVYTPDLYDGEAFNERSGAARKFQELGFDEILHRAALSVRELPETLVYAGFSNGGTCAELLSATRPGARGAILMHAPLMVRDLGWERWPANVPVQVHFAIADPIRNDAVIEKLRHKVETSGSKFERYDYDAPGHLFADPGLPAYSAPATELMVLRVLQFLSNLNG